MLTLWLMLTYILSLQVAIDWSIDGSSGPVVRIIGRNSNGGYLCKHIRILESKYIALIIRPLN